MMYVCQYCGRLMKYPVAHKYRDGFRKRKLKFETIMTDEEIIAVVTAHKEGKQIQQRSKGTKDWHDTDSPNWNFYVLDYRIAPSKKYRPFKNADEAFKESKKHGFWVKLEDDYRQICYINNSSVEFANEHLYTYKFDELTEFVWADYGSKCGILEE